MSEKRSGSMPFGPYRCSTCGRAQADWSGDGWVTCPRCGDEWSEDVLAASHELAPGHRIYRRGAEGQPLTVVRSNRATVTVDTDGGSMLRLPYREVGGYYAVTDLDREAKVRFAFNRRKDEGA